jgi:hypothetical protein
MYQDMGTANFLNLSSWSATDLASFGLTVGPLLIKASFMLGVGIGSSENKHLKEEKSK